MRVLHLFSSFLSPSEQWAFNLLKSEKDIEHYIAAQEYLLNNFYDKAFCFCPSRIGVLVSLDRQLKWSVQNFLLKLAIKGFKRFFPVDERAVIAFAREHGIEVVHAHFGPTAWRYRRVIEALDLPLVISFYGYDYGQVVQHQPRYKIRYQYLFAKASMVLAEGPAGAEKLKVLGCAEGKTGILPLSSLKGQMHKTLYYEKGGELKIVQVASYAWKKGQLDTLRACHMAKQNGIDIKLTLVGNRRDNGVWEAVQGFISDCGIQSWVVLVDWVDFEDMIPFLSENHIFMHPSKYAPDGDCEGGAPTILIQAMQAGLGIITTKHCDIPFLLQGYPYCLLFEEGDTQGMSTALVNIANNGSNVFNKCDNIAFLGDHQQFSSLNEAYEAAIKR